MSKVKRLVVKIGSSSVAGADNQLDLRVIRRLVKDVVTLRDAGIEVAIVSSGAVVAGMGRLGLRARPTAIAELQAAAAVGQNLLMHTYESLFKRHDVPVGQVLLTAGDMLEDRARYVNLRNTFRKLFSYAVVPVINENDSVAVAELKRTFGENDMLAAYVTNLVHAELLVMLSDVEGLYAKFDADGSGARPIAEIGDDDPLLEQIGRSRAGSRVGRGGIETKVKAAKLLMACGEMTVIAHARKHRLTDIVAGRPRGTLFAPTRRRMQSRKRWIGFASPCMGAVVVDDGAERAITKLGRSLLPAGVVGFTGSFSAGDVIRVESERGELARGLSRYDSGEIERILGKSSPEVERTLGKPALEVIHRDDLVLT